MADPTMDELVRLVSDMAKKMAVMNQRIERLEAQRREPVLAPISVSWADGRPFGG